MTKWIEKTSRHDRSNRFQQIPTYSRYRITPTTRPKPHNPSTVLCYIYVTVVTVSLVVIGPHGNLDTCIGSCEEVEWILLNGNDDVIEISTDAQISFSKYDTTLWSVGSNLTCAIEGIWTVDVSDFFVNMIVEACIWDSKRPITLNESGPKIHIKPPSVLFFWTKIVSYTSPSAEYISCS